MFYKKLCCLNTVVEYKKYGSKILENKLKYITFLDD